MALLFQAVAAAPPPSTMENHAADDFVDDDDDYLTEELDRYFHIGWTWGEGWGIQELGAFPCPYRHPYCPPCGYSCRSAG